MTQVYYQMHNILRRYYDEHGMYIEPTGVNDGGSVTGMMRAANNEVLDRLEREIHETRSKLNAIFDEITAYKRDTIGPNYNPMPSHLTSTQVREPQDPS
jgi:hypothetical protein